MEQRYQNELPKDGIILSKSRKKGYPRHFHYHIEIFYLISGKYSAIVDNVKYEINQGDLLIIFPYQFHEYVDISENNYEMVIKVDPNLLDDYESFFSKKYPRSSLLKASDINNECKGTIQWLINTHHSKMDVASLRKSLINTLFWYFTHNIEFDNIQETSLHTFHKIMKYCNEHCLEESFSLNSVSKALGYSPPYVSRIISQRLKTNFSSYTNQLRIYNACKLLCKTNESITNIAFMCGYSTVRNFNNKFSKYTGQSPRDYRKSNT